jgi:flagellar protein FlaJ
MDEKKQAPKLGETKEPLFTQAAKQFRLMKKRWKIMWVLSIVALALILVGVVFKPESLVLFVIGAFFELSVPFGFYMYLESSRSQSCEEHFPDFLRDIAEYKRSGVTLSRAIQNASHNDYGQLTPEVKRMAVELSWGVSFNDSMLKFSKRIESNMVDRAISIIIAAQEAGGEVTTVLETFSSDQRKLKELEAERKSKLGVYTMTIYAIYLLLLFIIIVLVESLVPAIPKMQAAGQFLGGGTSGNITEFEFRTLMFHVTMVEAFFSGIISGQMGEGKITAGIKHAVVLVLVSLLAFQLVPPATAVEKIAETAIDIPPTTGFASQGLEGVVQLDVSFTTKDVATKVREMAKQRNRETHKGFNPEDVEFVVYNCAACDQGLITITADTITVKQPTMIRFSVTYAKTKYQVSFQDANV